jgi:serine/threonine protein kinase
MNTKDQIKVSDRFVLSKKLGQGTFSFIYEAFDTIMQRNVALKIEKKDKNKNILMFEYNVLNCLKGLKHVCSAYDFVKNPE